MKISRLFSEDEVKQILNSSHYFNRWAKEINGKKYDRLYWTNYGVFDSKTKNRMNYIDVLNGTINAYSECYLEAMQDEIAEALKPDERHSTEPAKVGFDLFLEWMDEVQK